MTLEEAMISLGVDDTTLSTEEKLSLDQQGFVVMHDILSPDEVAGVSQRVDEITNNLEMSQHGKAFAKNVLDRGAVFEKCILKPRLIAAACHVLGPEIKFSGLNCNVELRGGRLQSLHLDWRHSITPGDWKAINSVWFIDEFTKENGATRLIPETHWTGQFPPNLREDVLSDQPDQVLAVGPPGSVVVFNVHTWHSSTPNTTDTPRRALHCMYCKVTEDQFLVQRDALSEETKARLSPEAKVLADVD